MKGPLVLGRSVEAGAVYSDEVNQTTAKANRAVNAARGLPAHQAGAEARDAEVAIVGYGPSLAQTWPQILRLHVPVWTSSKAHDFLIGKGLLPVFHTDVDYRQHKADFVTPSRGVRYIMASHVHPDFIDKLAGYNVRLFHSQVPAGGPYEAGYPLIAAQFDAGLMAAKLAYDLGYRKQVWFGLDGSMLDDGQTHAGPHEGILGQAGPLVLRVGSRDYQSNELLMRAALWTERMLRQHPRMQVTITGDGALRPFLQERGRVRVQ